MLAASLEIAFGRLSWLPARIAEQRDLTRWNGWYDTEPIPAGKGGRARCFARKVTSGSRGVMIMNVKACGATRRMSRLARWLAGRNALRRPVDRIEGAVLVVLSAACLVAVAVAAILGTHTYQSQRAASAGLRPAVAVLIQAGPFYGSMAHLGQAEAHWRDPGGGEQSGMLTTVTTPGIIRAAAGARIPVWLDRSGQPAAPPGGQVAMIVDALAVGAGAAGGAVAALLICYALCRLALDRRRLAAWESAWSLTGPRWTTRR